MHDRGVHHHDLHLGNILKRADEKVFIIDFGSAAEGSSCTDKEECNDHAFLKDLGVPILCT